VVTGMGRNAGRPSQGAVGKNVVQQRSQGQRGAVPDVGTQASEQGVGCRQE